MISSGIGMLEEARLAQNNLAWLRDSQHKKALHVRRWQSAPEARDPSFFAPDFALNTPEPWLVGDEIPWPEPVHVPLPSLSHRVEPSAADFDRLHEEILQRIQAGEFQKVVPIVCEELEFERRLTPAMFPRAFAEHVHQFSYG